MEFESNLSKTWREGLLASDTSIRDAIKNLDRTCLQIILCVDSSGCMLGTLTDGDIRRGLLKGCDMSTPIGDIIHKSPIVVPPGLSKETVLQLMSANRIHQLPIVNEQRVVVGLHLWEELISPSSRKNVMVIMAGGRGTRLLPHTEKCPKPMLEVNGKPILEHIVLRAKSEGFQNFIISLHYYGHIIENYFDDGSKWDVNIQYIKEKEPLGTAGALSLLNPRPEEPFIVTNGDVLSDIRYGEMIDFHKRYAAQATMAVRLHEWRHPFGVVKTKGVDIVGFEEKPISRSHINAGVYVLDPKVLSTINEGKRCDMPSLFEELKTQNRRIIVYPMHEPWLDVGSPDDLVRARAGGDDL